MILVITSGYFDPIHKGHVEYLTKSKQLGDKLVVILNNDKQAMLKKKCMFMPIEDKIQILSELRSVDAIFLSIDDDLTVCKSIQEIWDKSQSRHYSRIIFAKGGDRMSSEIPEATLCAKLGIDIVDSLGQKIQSSSALTGRDKTL